MSLKNKKSKGKSPSFNWKKKLSIFKFLGAFLGGITLFYLVYYSIPFTDYVKSPLLHAQAAIGASFLNIFGLSVTATNAIIAGAETSVKIAGGCDGLEATALLTIAMLVFPIPFKYKWPGLVMGVLFLSVLNILRIAGLYLTSLYWPSAFEFMHIQGGLYVYAIIIVIIMLIWSDWALKKYRADQLLS